MKNRAGKTVQNLSGEMVYTSFYPQPLPPQPNIEIDTEMQHLLFIEHKGSFNSIVCVIHKVVF